MGSLINLGEVLRGDVPNSGTVREQIEYIDIALIDSDPNNFYELSDIDQLAANIELCGLQQPIRVRTNPDDPNRVIIVSGHRRRAAIEKLVQEGREDLKEIPCIREQRTGSAALQELQLIYANSDTRRMSSADISKQAERVEALLYQLKEEGYEFPGRMRDHVAEACKVSKSKLSRLKVIRENLTKKLKKDWEKGKIHESAAYAFAQKPVDVQDKVIFYLSNRSYGTNPEDWNAGTIEVATGYAEKLMALKCKKCGGTCENVDPMLLRLAAGSYWGCACRQGKCCATCSELVSCKKACPHLSDKVKQLRADRKAQRDHDAEVQAERDRPTINRIKAYWVRFGEARAAADISVKSWHKAMEMCYGGADGKVDAEYIKKEAGEKIKRDTTLPYGYNFYYGDADRLCKAADRLGCSIDYLLCRTDDPKGFAANVPAEQQQAGLGECRWYPAAQFPDDKQDLIAIDKDGYATDGAFENGRLRGTGFDWDEVLFWTPAPDPDGIVRNVPQPTGQLMISGWMPGGTTPTEPCEVVAIFDLGNGTRSKQFLQWTGSEFAFTNGAKIDMEPVKWMRLPPDEEG